MTEREYKESLEEIIRDKAKHMTDILWKPEEIVSIEDKKALKEDLRTLKVALSKY